MRSRTAAGKYRRGSRLDRDDLDRRVALFECLADPADSPARADPGYEDIDLPGRIAPYFQSRRPAVRGRVGRIFKLLPEDRSGVLRADRFGPGDSPFHPFGTGSQDNLRPQRT